MEVGGSDVVELELGELVDSVLDVGTVESEVDSVVETEVGVVVGTVVDGVVVGKPVVVGRSVVLVLLVLMLLVLVVLPVLVLLVERQEHALEILTADAEHGSAYVGRGAVQVATAV